MAGKVVNIKVCSPLKQHSGLLATLREAFFGRLTGKCIEISYTSHTNHSQQFNQFNQTPQIQ